MPRNRRNEPTARSIAVDILERIERGQGHSNALLGELPDRIDSRDRALATELVYGVLRHRTSLDRLVEAASSRSLDAIEPLLRNDLRVAIYQITRLTRVPRSAAVNEAVALARAGAGEGAAGFVNGVLRAACRRLDEGRCGAPEPPPPDAPEPVVRSYFETTHSFPEFLVRRFLGRYGRIGTGELLAALNRPAPTVLRPTKRGAGAAAIVKRLEAEGIATQPSPWLPEAIRVAGGAAPRSRAFRDGAFYIQDEASQLVARLVQPLLPGHNLVDLCAAPGGKFLALVEARSAGGGVMLAADRHRRRLQGLWENADRLGVTGFQAIVTDAARPGLGARFMRVLLDAPCSGTGIIRRHPEIRWRRSDDQIRRMARWQAEALPAACDLVAPGGRLVYAVCSLEPEEGPERIAALLSARPEMQVVDARTLLPAPAAPLVDASGFLATLPHRDDIDGFFAAVLMRRPDRGRSEPA